MLFPLVCRHSYLLHNGAAVLVDSKATISRATAHFILLPNLLPVTTTLAKRVTLYSNTVFFWILFLIDMVQMASFTSPNGIGLTTTWLLGYVDLFLPWLKGYPFALSVDCMQGWPCREGVCADVYCHILPAIKRVSISLIATKYTISNLSLLLLATP